MSEVNAQIAADLAALEPDADFAPGAAGADVGGLESLETAELCTMAVGMLFAVIAGRRGDHWNLSPDEAGRLGTATGRVLDRYLPNLKTGPEAALLLAVVIVVAPRIAQDKAGGAGGNQPEHIAP